MTVNGHSWDRFMAKHGADVTKLSDWLSGHIENIEHGEGPVSRLVLIHVIKGGKNNEVATVKVPYNSGYDDDLKKEIYGVALQPHEVDDLARQLWNQAWDDCEGIGGQNAYAIRLYRKHQSRSLGRFSFRLLAEDDSDMDFSGIPELSGGANAPALLGQLMRHNEASNRALVQSIGTTFGVMARTIDKQAGQIESMIEGRMAMIEMAEELASRKHERQLALEESRVTNELKQQSYEKLMLLMGPLLNRVIGKKVLPEETTPTEEMVHGLITSLTPAQLSSVQQLLRPEQMAPFFELLNNAIDRKEGEAEKRLQLIAGGDSENG